MNNGLDEYMLREEKKAMMAYAIEEAKRRVERWYHCKDNCEWIEASFTDLEGNPICTTLGSDKYRVFIIQGSPPRGCVIADYGNNGTVKMHSLLFWNKTYTFKNVYGYGTLGDLKDKI